MVQYNPILQFYNFGMLHPEEIHEVHETFITTICFVQGAFAFEEAMTRGSPLEEEVELLRQAAGGNDELIDVALESLPEDLLTKGTKTQLQLQREASLLRFNGSELVLYKLLL